jgi:hypothetical protein
VDCAPPSKAEGSQAMTLCLGIPRRGVTRDRKRISSDFGRGSVEGGTKLGRMSRRGRSGAVDCRVRGDSQSGEVVSGELGDGVG